MWMNSNEFANHVFLLCSEIIFVALDKGQQALMPWNDHPTLVFQEACKVLADSIDNANGQIVLFVNQDLQEYWIRRRVVHFSNAINCGSRLQHWNRNFAEHCSDCCRFSKCTIAALEERQEMTISNNLVSQNENETKRSKTTTKDVLLTYPNLIIIQLKEKFNEFFLYINQINQ